MNYEEFERAVERIKDKLARAAQKVYDDWIQIDGHDDYYGAGGICDDVAVEMGYLVQDELDVDAYSEHIQSDSHTVVMVDLDEGRAMVDIPPRNYETGFGYRWTKIPGVRFHADMVVVDWFD